MAYTEMKPAEIRSKTDEEIGDLIRQSREKLFSLKMQAVSEKIEDNSQFRKIRRDVARLMTERRARHIAGTGNGEDAA